MQIAYIDTVTIDQRNSYGYVDLTTRYFGTTLIKVVQADNWGPGPYGAYIGWDAIQAVPIR